MSYGLTFMKISCHYTKLETVATVEKLNSADYSVGVYL